MNSKFEDYQLKELLDVNCILKENTCQISEIFDAIATKLFNEYRIKKGNNIYNFLEIEFYYYEENHKDVITYKREIEGGHWFFHASGLDISFKSSYKDRDLINSFYGGILIRSLLKVNEIDKIYEIITGPQKCCWELFDSFNAFSINPHDYPVIENKSDGKNLAFHKTKRWITIKKDKAKIRFDKDYETYEAFLSHPYRYFIEHPALKKINTSHYKARPWD